MSSPQPPACHEADFGGVRDPRSSTALAAGRPVQAHHAVGELVDTRKRVVQHMLLTKIDWINPHTWFHFDPTRPATERCRT